MNFYIKILYIASEPILTSPNILTTNWLQNNFRQNRFCGMGIVQKGNDRHIRLIPAKIWQN